MGRLSSDELDTLLVQWRAKALGADQTARDSVRLVSLGIHVKSRATPNTLKTGRTKKRLAREDRGFPKKAPALMVQNRGF